MSNRIGDNYNRYNPTNFSEMNSKQYDQNNYSNVYNQEFNTKLSISQEPDIEYEEQVHYLSISSKDRDINTYPNVNNYTIYLSNEYRNISTVELVQAIIPAKNNVEAEPYLLLNIEEIQETVSSLDKNISKSFAILQLTSPTTTGGFIQIDKRIHENTIKYFQIPKASLSKMSINICDSDGNLFDFEGDSNTFTKGYQNTFIFKIVTLEKKRRQLDQRNVY